MHPTDPASGAGAQTVDDQTQQAEFLVVVLESACGTVWTTATAPRGPDSQQPDTLTQLFATAVATPLERAPLLALARATQPTDAESVADPVDPELLKVWLWAATEGVTCAAHRAGAHGHTAVAAAPFLVRRCTSGEYLIGRVGAWVHAEAWQPAATAEGPWAAEGAHPPQPAWLALDSSGYWAPVLGAVQFLDGQLQEFGTHGEAVDLLGRRRRCWRCSLVSLATRAA